MEFLENWFFAFLGAFVLYTVSLYRDRQPYSLLNALDKATRHVPSHRSKCVILLDMIATSALGKLLLVAVFHPESWSESGMLGLLMTGTFSAFAKDI
jgi:hypothetical protein